jgi:hypothetical protein
LRENFPDKKWLQINQAVVFNEFGWSSKTTDLRQLGTVLYKIRCKWEHHVKQSGGGRGGRGGGGGGSSIVVVIIS